MEIRESTLNDVAVLHLAGRIWEEADSLGLSNAMSNLKSQGHLRVVLDLSEVTLLNGSGLGALIAAMKYVQEAGGKLVLARTNSRIQNLLQITKLYHVLKTFDSVDAAMQYLNA